MSKEQSVPKLRFPGFSEGSERGEGEWERKRLGEVAILLKGKGLSKADIISTGKTPCIRYGELYTQYGELIREVISRTDLDPKELVLSELNDVIVPASGESPIEIATASCVMLSGIALGGDLNVIRTDLNGVFLAYFINHKRKGQIAALAQGATVTHLYPAQLIGVDIAFPTLPEQTKIADFLTAVDERLQILKRKKALLEQYKKGMMQRLFSQELRFKDADGKDFPDWEERRLGEVAIKRIEKNKGRYVSQVFTNSAIQGIINQQDFFERDIANKENTDGYYLVEKDDFVYNPRISVSAPVGPISRNHLGLGLMSPLYSVFRFQEGHLDFFEQYFFHTSWHAHMYDISNFGARSDRMSFLSPDFYDMPLPYPSLAEQTKIADFLSSLDTKIQVQQGLISRMETWKKGLLQAMFVG